MGPELQHEIPHYPDLPLLRELSLDGGSQIISAAADRWPLVSSLHISNDINEVDTREEWIKAICKFRCLTHLDCSRADSMHTDEDMDKIRTATPGIITKTKKQARALETLEMKNGLWRW